MPQLRFIHSVRAKLLLIALLLLLIPVIGFRFIQQMDRFLREGQQQVLISAARLLSATLSDRPQLFPPADGSDEVDMTERRRLLALFGSSDPETAASLGSAYQPSGEVEKMLSVVASDTSRIWVVDARSRVRGLAGSLGASKRDSNTGLERNWAARLYSIVIKPIVRAYAADPTGPTREDVELTRRAVMSQVDRALIGEPNARWRDTMDFSAVILSVAQPIWRGDDIVGAVVVEETTRGTQSIKYAALESMLATTLVILIAGFVALLGFAWRLAFRVRRLQSEAVAAIDPHGRIQGSFSGSNDRDEIGALSRSLRDTMQRLQRYNEYLEHMASRLSHELRTPLAVVRSSLDNLRQGSIVERDQVYLIRADEGVQRLAALIARMSEASQLESMLQSAEPESFDLVSIVRGLVEGYRLAYPGQGVKLDINAAEPLQLNGVPDAVAQLLDKLVQNAVDFAFEQTDVAISIRADSKVALLIVENKGPLLAGHGEGLFLSMVSTRSRTSGKSHLGLGLYIVRLIAEYHGGTVTGSNLAEGDGVRFEVRLPLQKSA